jgi:hypothetical protein
VEPRSGKPVEVYCDGGVWQGVMTDAVTAHASDFVGRTAVVIPELDYGVVKTFYDSDPSFGLAPRFIDSLALPNGHENSFYAEMMAVRHADEACKRNGLKDGFVICTDNGGAVKESKLLYVQHIPPERHHPADEYLYKMRSRAGYVRRSTGKVKYRRPVSPINAEIERLMKAERVEFRLATSPLYQKFKAEANL